MARPRRGLAAKGLRPALPGAAALLFVLAAVPSRLLPAAAQPAAAPPLAVSSPPAGRAAPDAPVIEVPYQQVVTVAHPGASRVLAVNPEVVEASLLAPGVIQLRAVAFGRTFLHVWTAAGRLTRTLQVVPPPVDRPTLAQQVEREEARAKHLTLEYRDRFRTLRRGPSLEDTDRQTTTFFDHDLTARMASPYGELSGRLAFQRVNQAADLSSWSAALTRGDLGPLEQFDLIVGDSTAGFSDFSLPFGTIRGAQVRYDDLAPYRADAFYGRRRLGFATGLSSVSDVEDDVFLSGARLQDMEAPWTWWLAYGSASGEDRVDLQASQAVEANTRYWLSPGFALGAEAGRTQDEAHGYRLTSVVRGRHGNVEAAYRNVSQRYENLLGRSPDQGERGLLLSSHYAPAPPWRLRQRLDLYRDTLFHNPEEPSALNLDMDWGMELDLTERTVWGASYGRQRLLGRLFPTDTTSFHTNLRRRVRMIPLLKEGSAFVDYLAREIRSVSTPESDFESHTVRLGVGAPFWEAFSWQLSQQWTFLEATRSGTESQPRETAAGLSYFRQFARLPLTLRSGVNVSFVSQAGSPSSFLADEDRASWDASLRYDVTPNLQAFLGSRLLRRAQPAAREYEIDVETGVRYVFDTGVRWEPAVTLAGIVYHDANEDRERQAGERGLPRVAVRAGTRDALTDAAGRFYLGRVRGAQVEVAVDLSSVPPGYVPTSPAAVTIDAARPPPLAILFGFTAQAELRVRVFLDAAGDGRYEATDVPLPGVRVTLEDGTTLATDAGGWAVFRGVEPGAHALALRVDDLPPGTVPATPPSQERAVGEGELAAVEFPVKAERSLAGRVYVDRDRNGRHEGDEPVLPGVVLCLDEVRRVKTREDGRYLFKDVTAGVHRVALNCGSALDGYLPLSATVQTMELGPQPVQRRGVDFRVGEKDAILQGVTADVLRERRERLTREQAMDEAAADARRRVQQRAARAAAIERAVSEAPRGRGRTVVIDVVVDVPPADGR